jgi:superfamily II DNA or RNA helicase
MELRPYQIEDYESIKNSFENVDKVLYQLSTGGGKTVVISQIVCEILDQEKKFLILVHKEKLLRQMVKTLKSRGLFVGHIIRREHVNIDAMVVVASVSTVMNEGRIDLIKGRMFDYIIIDEAHHSVTNSFTKVIDAANHGSSCKILGVTATPYRSDSKNLKDVFEQLIVSSAPMRKLIKDGFLSPYKIYATPVSELQEKVGKSGSDYKISDLSKYMREPEMIQYIVQSYEKFASGRKTICFCVDVKHAQDVMGAFKSKGYSNVAYIDSSTKSKDREAIFENFQTGDLEIIFCIETLTEGVDLPECTAVQLARPTLSLILYLQMVGRGLRPKPHGGDCVIVDNAGLTYEFGVPDSDKNWQLDSDLNPVVKSDKILVARRKDGNLTDNIENEEYSELLEMDWEEFMSQSMMTEKEAQEHNEKIKQAKLTTLREIGEFVIKESKLHNLKYEGNWSGGITIRSNDSYYHEFEINQSEGEKEIQIKFNGNHYENKKGVSFVMNHINFNFTLCKVVKDNQTRIQKAFDYIIEQKKKEIDIDKLRKAIGEKKKVLVQNLLQTELEKGITEFSFEAEWNVWASRLKSSFEGKVIRIKFLNKNLNKKCKLDITTEEKNFWSTFPKINNLEEKSVYLEEIINVFEVYFDKKQ